MRPTKIFFLSLIGVLLFAGLFVFLRQNNSVSENSTDHLKPSQMNFSQSNLLGKKNLGSETSKHENEPEVKSRTINLENLSAEEKTKWSTFETILKTKNDNDPRLDQEFKKLTPQFRNVLYEKFAQLPPEDHSGRGLIVYLIGREISSAEDMQFLKKIYQEQPCLSLPDCKTAPSKNESHHTSTDQTTLVYEQLSALYLIDKKISENPNLLADAAMRSEFIQVLAQAESFPVPVVYEKAKALRAKYAL